MLDLTKFYAVISPEQDSEGNVIINRRIGQLRNWYFCSQPYDKTDETDSKVLEIINSARVLALYTAHSESLKNKEVMEIEEFHKSIFRPKSANNRAAKIHMSNKLVIVLDNFDVENGTCDVHNGLFCRNIDDDPLVWKSVGWGRKYTKKRNHQAFNTLGDNMPELKNVVSK